MRPESPNRYREGGIPTAGPAKLAMPGQRAGLVHSSTACRLHDIDPYTHLVDLLQRVGQHLAARVAELTPRQRKTRFADSPLRSDLHKTAC